MYILRNTQGNNAGLIHTKDNMNDKTYDDEIFGRAWWSNVHQGYLFNSDGLSLNPADF